MTTIPKTMKAAVLYGPHDIRLEDVAVPRPGSNEVLIRVKACGICGTDSHIYSGALTIGTMPIILGHEFAGEVVAVGQGVTVVSEGDRVTADINMSCGKCYFCLRGQKLLCREVQQLGVHIAGAFAQYVKVPEEAIRKLKPGMSYRQGALVEPLACVIHGQDRMGIGIGYSVAVLGAGPIGILHALLAKVRGATPIIVSEVADFRLGKACDLGFDKVIDAKVADPVREVMEATEGIGADVVIEAVGSVRVFEQALQMVRPGGGLLVFGGHPADAIAQVHPYQFYHNELVVLGSYAGSYDTWLQAIALLGSGQLNADSLATHVVPLEEIPGLLKGLEHEKTALKAIWVNE